MDKYKITLNGKVYDVQVEKLEMGLQESSINDVPKVEKELEATLTSSESIEAPIPGGVLDVKVKVGDKVKSGETLVVIEAMKLENEIVAPRDGKIGTIFVSKGDTVALGDKLISLQ